MAIVEIKKLELIGLNIERDRIMSALGKTRVFEVKKTAPYEGTHAPADHMKRQEQTASKLARLSFGIDFVYSRLNELKMKLKKIEKAEKKMTKKKIPFEKCEYSYIPEKKPFMGGRTIVSEHEFDTIYTREYELFGTIDELEKINFRFIEIANELRKKKALLSDLKPYRAFSAKFSAVRDTKTTKAVFGKISIGRYFDVAALRRDNPQVSLTMEQSGIAVIAALVAAPEDFDAVYEKLVNLGFDKCQYDFDMTAAEKIDEIEKEIKILEAEYFARLNDVQDYIVKYKEFKLYFDYLTVEAERLSAMNGLMVTDHAFILEGFFPAHCEDKIKNAVYSITTVAELNIREVTMEDKPPTLLKNHFLVNPYESVTEMYASPSYNEVDPNIFVAFFYFIFFGLMLGDAGYGLLLSVACFLILKFCKVENGTRKLLMILGMGGISTIVWGIVMGGVFGIEGIPALWFNPIDEPLTLLILSLGLGFFHLMFGLGIKGYQLIKKGKPWSALFDVGLIYLLFIGVGAMAVGIMQGMNALKTVGIVLLLIALVGMILTQGREKPTIAGKIASGFGSLYNLVNYVSDLLSYCRVFGLGLATAVIGLVANQLATVMFNLVPVLGHIIGLVLLLLLHGISIGINTLSAYVHTSRLQFVEFFGKFYEGDGRAFRPLGMYTKYTRIETVQEKTNT